MKNIKRILTNSPYLLLIFGFLSVILTGTIILMTPLVSTTGESTSFFNALFTATSATCVTGLIVFDTGTYFNEIGHIVIMLLIQIGGIGIMAFIALCIHLFKGKLSIKNKINVKEAYNVINIGDGLRIIKSIFIISLTMEIIGAIILSFVFIPEFGVSKGLFYSLFHSISAFNNAGFDLNGNFSSLTNYVGNPIINFTIMALITIGSLGFIAILDIIDKKSFKKLSLTTKLVLCLTGTLLVLGFISFFILEAQNPKTLGELNFFEKILASLFLSVTARTAGFNTIDISGLTVASNLIFIVLMYIGASPTSTGGGLKTTTVLVPILSIIALFKGKDEIEVFERRIPRNLILKSSALITVVFLFSLVSTILLSLTENADFITILFEVASAINTVGLSLGLTPYLSIFGKLIIIILMFIGRIGPLTIVMALSLKQKSENSIKYIEEKILIG